MIAFVRKFCRGWTNQWILLVSSSSDITNPLGYSLVYEYTLSSPFLSLEKRNLLHRFFKSLKTDMMLLVSFSGQVTCVCCAVPKGLAL